MVKKCSKCSRRYDDYKQSKSCPHNDLRTNARYEYDNHSSSNQSYPDISITPIDMSDNSSSSGFSGGGGDFGGGGSSGDW